LALCPGISVIFGARHRNGSLAVAFEIDDLILIHTLSRSHRCCLLGCLGAGVYLYRISQCSNEITQQYLERYLERQDCFHRCCCYCCFSCAVVASIPRARAARAAATHATPTRPYHSTPRSLNLSRHVVGMIKPRVAITRPRWLFSMPSRPPSPSSPPTKPSLPSLHGINPRSKSTDHSVDHSLSLCIKHGLLLE